MLACPLPSVNPDRSSPAAARLVPRPVRNRVSAAGRAQAIVIGAERRIFALRIDREAVLLSELTDAAFAVTRPRDVFDLLARYHLPCHRREQRLDPIERGSRPPSNLVRQLPSACALDVAIGAHEAIRASAALNDVVTPFNAELANAPRPFLNSAYRRELLPGHVFTDMFQQVREDAALRALASTRRGPVAVKLPHDAGDVAGSSGQVIANVLAGLKALSRIPDAAGSVQQ
jgi:hypothetical protein